MPATEKKREQRTYTIPASAEDLQRVDTLIDGATVGGTPVKITRAAMMHALFVRGLESAEEERHKKGGGR